MQEQLQDEPIISDTRPPQGRPRVGPKAPRRIEYVLLVLAGLGVCAIALYSWRVWHVAQAGMAASQARPAASAPVVALPPPAPASAVPPGPPPIKYPVEPVAEQALPPLDESDIELARRIEALAGPQGLSQLRMNAFVRHMVATVDNLTRSHAPAHMWPVNQAPGRFTTLERGGQSVVSPDNEARYAPLVLLAESIDTERLVALYRTAYPLFQQAYEELGFPGRYFNDRLIEVIDHLMAAPEPAGPLVVERVDVEGPVQLARPWVHYVFADAGLEALSSGQKIMVRVGLVNERRLKAQLSKIRAALIRQPPPR